MAVIIAFSSGIVMILASPGSGSSPPSKSIIVPPLPVDRVISSRRNAEAANAVNLMYNCEVAFFRVKSAVAKTQ